MTSNDDIRLVRARADAQAAALADADKAGHSMARSFVGRVYRGIHPPTGNDKFVLTYRCQLSGTEVEDTPVGVAALTEAGIPVAVLGAVPDAGRNLIAHLVDGLWAAATRGAGCREPNTIRVRVIHQCDGTPIAGARVKIYRSAGAVPPNPCASGPLVLNTTTDAAGIAEYTPYLPYQFYCIHVEYDWTGGTCIGEFDFNAPGACVAQELLLIACAGRLVVTVTDRDTGAPLSGASISYGAIGVPAADGYCLSGIVGLGWVESPPGTYTLDLCNRFLPYVGGCVGKCPLPTYWDVRKSGYLNCCGLGSFSCDEIITWATSLQPIEPDWVLGSDAYGHPCCEGDCGPYPTVASPSVLNCGPRGRLIKKQLHVILTAADPRVFGANSGVPILLTWNPTLGKWDSGCLTGDGSTYRCQKGSDFIDKEWKSIRVLMSCGPDGGYVGQYQKWGTVTDCGGAFGTGVGATECPPLYTVVAGYWLIEFGRMTGSICNPAGASGYARDLGQLGFPVVGSSEVLE